MHRTIILVLTLVLSGRAMTLAFIHRAGGQLAGDPPSAWLMPLLGDAIIGLFALFVAFLIYRKKGLWVWVTIIIWNVVAIWDALSAYVIHLTNPWPEFFMIKAFGPSMFFIAIAIHLLIIVLASSSPIKKHEVAQN